MPLRETLTTLLRPLYHRIRGVHPKPALDPRWTQVQTRLAQARRIIDLGCGSNPVPGACVGVDLYREPRERILGAGAPIDEKTFERRGIAFVNSRIDVALPFEEKEFDFAYSHHVFEHLEDPWTACHEAMRIAKAGAIITPSILAELVFGRPYHRWLILDRANLLLFLKKRPFEDRPFGEHPRWNPKRATWTVEKETNPFEILLNDGNWYHGGEKLPRLARILRRHWESRSPLMEVVFLWDNRFDVRIYE